MSQNSRFTLIGKLAAVCLLLIAGCRGAVEEPTGVADQAPPLPVVLARVDDAVITVADLERAIDSTPRPEQFDYIDAPQRLELLESLIDRKLMAMQARIVAFDRQPGIADALAAAGGDGFEEERILAQAYWDATVGAGQFTANEIETYYRDNPAEFTEAERVQVTRAVMPDEQSIRQASARLRDGVDVVELKNLMAGRGQANTLWFQRREDPGPIEEAAFALSPGEVSDLIPVRDGLVVFRVDQKIPARLRPLDDVRAGIVARLDQQRRTRKREQLLSTLRKSATISIDQDALAAFHWQD